MARITGGDRAAFATLMARYLTPVFRYAFSLLHEAGTAEDVAQETFLRVWRQAGRWQNTGRVQGWLFRIAHNLGVDELRRRRPHLSFEESEDLLPASPPLQEVHAEQRGTTRALEKALFSLPARQRSALWLVYYESMRGHEAAAVMGVSPDAFESLLARGKKNLKKVLVDPVGTGLTKGVGT